MAGTRDKVLKTLLNQPRSTINELAEEVGINPISVRHHITSLQAEGKVDSEEEIHGVGRPRRVYYLTEAGVEQFPTRYIRLTVRLIEQLKETMPDKLVDQLFSNMAEDLAREISDKTDTDTLTMEERLELVKEFLHKEGFDIDWEKHGNEYIIHEASCPYYHIGQNHPEVCSVDEVFISTVLSVPAAKTQCILNGDSFCTFVVSEPPLVETP
jgi:predicted ArsR family transcriptional regulator